MITGKNSEKMFSFQTNVSSIWREENDKNGKSYINKTFHRCPNLVSTAEKEGSEDSKSTSRKESSLLLNHDRVLLGCKYTCCDHCDNVIMSYPTVKTLSVTAVRKGATCPLIVSQIATILTDGRRATV